MVFSHISLDFPDPEAEHLFWMSFIYGFFIQVSAPAHLNLYIWMAVQQDKTTSSKQDLIMNKTIRGNINRDSG